MPVILRENQYAGVNAHLNSFLQNESGEWQIFHSAHVNDIARALDADLPPGYEVSLEKGLQIREYHRTTGEPITRRPVPDVSIYRTGQPAKSTSNPKISSTTSPTLTLRAVETLEEDDADYYLISVVIRKRDNSVLITRLELLSPTNKPSGDGYAQYLEKRNLTLRTGTALVEIDYLHQTPPIIRPLPSYPDRQSGSYPYSIIVTDPRPTLGEGEARVYGFGVDEAIPTVDIPLSDGDTLSFDFGAVYQRTFAGLRYFCNRADYEQEPERFDSYTEADQQRIRARMAAVLAAQENN